MSIGELPPLWQGPFTFRETLFGRHLCFAYHFKVEEYVLVCLMNSRVGWIAVGAIFVSSHFSTALRLEFPYHRSPGASPGAHDSELFST